MIKVSVKNSPEQDVKTEGDYYVCERSGFLSLLNHFLTNKRGGIAIVFGILVLPFMMMAGVAIDLSRALIVRDRLSHALDAAGLAVGASINLTEQEMQQLATDFFIANYPEDEMGVPGAISISATEDIVTLSANATLPTTIMAIFGYDELTVHTDAEITRERVGLEVVMVLDNTGSMSGQKIEDLKSASADLVNILFGDEETPDNLKIGLVPFAAGVNVGPDADDWGWMDTNAESSIAGENFEPSDTGDPINVFDLYDQIPNRAWDGCIETRVYPLDVLDTSPGGDPDTLWLPYFAPDEPDSSDFSNYQNSYLSDDPAESSDGAAAVQRNWEKYENGDSASGSSRGPLYGCTVSPMTAMTNNKTELLDAIDAMGASGYTHIPIGMAWGWRMASPGEPFTEGEAYDNPEYEKAIILLTDGQNTIRYQGTHNKSSYSAYGYVANARLGSTSRSASVNEMNDRTEEVCDNVVDAGIRVYAITFQVDDDQTRDLMRACASDEELYFESPSGEQLRAIFQAIAQDLSNLRISK